MARPAWLRRSLTGLIVISAAAGALTAVPNVAQAAAPATNPTVTGAPCAPKTGVTVEVDFQKSGATETDATQNRIVLSCALGVQQNGFAALANAGFTTGSQAGAGTICEINGLPRQGYPYCWLTVGYWAYWRSNGTAAWSSSNLGPSSVPPIPIDSVEGWAFTFFSDNSTGGQPRIAIADLANYRKVVAGTPTISGTPAVGDTLTAHPGTWQPAATKLTYAWLSNGTAIAGATKSTYVVKKADRGAKLSVRVSGTSTGYTAASATSAPVTVAAPALDTAKIVASLPAHFATKAKSTVTVSLTAGASGVTPLGTVVLTVGSTTFTKKITAAAPTATFNVPKLAAGSYATSVSYAGSTSYQPSATATVTITSV